MKKISLLIPCYNEVANVAEMAKTLTALMRDQLSAYDYEILFIDNYSTDGTRAVIENICQEDKK